MNKLIAISVFALVFFGLYITGAGIASAQYYNNYNCAYHAYQNCSGGNLYWYDSCGNPQGIAQYCTNGCYNNSCGYNNYNYNNNCTYHAYRLCSGNNIYWYDSCGNQQDLYYNCVGGQTCQYGQCANYSQPAPVQSYSNYVAHYRTACYGNSLYWYDSLGVASGLYKNCGAGSACVRNSCAAIAPTPASAPVQTNCGNGLCEPNLGETTTTCPADCKVAVNPPVSALSVSFFAKQESKSTQWQKSAQVGSNGQIFFMISLANNSAVQLDNVNVSANIPAEVSSLGNLQINGVPVAGDIVAGISVGSISPSTTKSVTFEGKTQIISTPSTKQAIATSNSQTDSVSINFNPAIAAATAVSAAPATSGFVGFLQRWYIWILAGLILIILFIIVFRRLSSDV